MGAGGGGGGGGVVTATVTEEVREPPGPVAVSVYVTEFAGETLRLPVACTVPTPLSIDTLLAFATSQRNVDDCPRWIEVGSAVKDEIAGGAGAGGGGGGAACGGGGGGGGGAAFFLHPDANIINEKARTAAEIFRLSNMNLASQFPVTVPKQV